MNVIFVIIWALIACATLVFLMFGLVHIEMRMQIKSYNKRHNGQFDENTNPWTMSKRYQNWYIANFANMKEGSYDENEK